MNSPSNGGMFASAPPAYNTGVSAYNPNSNNSENNRESTHSAPPKLEAIRPEGCTSAFTSPVTSPVRLRTPLQLSNPSSAQPRRRISYEAMSGLSATTPIVIPDNTETKIVVNKYTKRNKRLSLFDIARFLGMVVNYGVTIFVCLCIWYVFRHAPEEMASETARRVNNCTEMLKVITRRVEFPSNWRSYADLKDTEISKESHNYILDSSCSESWKVGNESGVCCERIRNGKIQAFAQRREDLKVDIDDIAERIESKGVLSRDEKDIWYQVQALASSSMREDIRNQCEHPIATQVMQKDSIVIMRRFLDAIVTSSYELRWYQTVALLMGLLVLVLSFLSKPLEVFVDLAVISAGLMHDAFDLCRCRKGYTA